MANLNIEQKKVKSLFQESKYNFLIPDYQRPYAWGEMEWKDGEQTRYYFPD